MNEKFPKIKKSIKDFLNDEDGSITRNKVLMIGGMVLILGMLFSDEVFAAHRSHSSHRTHTSHRTSNAQHGSHNSHGSSHSTHSTHTNHATHGSHSSHASHVSYTEANNYGSTATMSGRAWPSLSDIQSIEAPAPASADITAMIGGISVPESGSYLPQVHDGVPEMQSPPDTPKLTTKKE